MADTYHNVFRLTRTGGLSMTLYLWRDRWNHNVWREGRPRIYENRKLGTPLSFAVLKERREGQAFMLFGGTSTGRCFYNACFCPFSFARLMMWCSAPGASTRTLCVIYEPHSYLSTNTHAQIDDRPLFHPSFHWQIPKSQTTPLLFQPEWGPGIYSLKSPVYFL